MVNRHKAVTECKLEWCVSSPPQSIKAESIKDGQIHLWLVDVEKLLGVNAKQELLTEAEITRAQRICNDAHRQRYLGGRVGLRLLLSAYTGIANAELAFGYGTRGKPKLLNTVSAGRLEFNYTLSNRFALYAFALNRALGVDLEIFPRTVATGQLAKRILTDHEQTAWCQVEKKQQNDVMLACWTRKEAYGKVLGVGIRYAMNQVNLFTDLQQAQWRTKISGLFSNETSGQVRALFGIQLGLPVAGVASLMYSQDGFDDVVEPELRAFQLQG